MMKDAMDGRSSDRQKKEIVTVTSFHLAHCMLVQRYCRLVVQVLVQYSQVV